MHLEREPQRAVFGVAVPAAIAVEVFGAGHLGRDVARGGAAFVALVAAHGPFAESVVGQRCPGVAQFARTAFTPEFDTLAGVDDEAVGVVDAQAATPAAGMAGVVDAVQPVVAAAQRAQSGFVGDEFDLFGDFARAHAQRQAAAVQLEAHALVVQGQHLQFGGAAQAQHGGADAQFGMRLRRRRNTVAAGQRPVALGLVPLAVLRVEPPHLALHVGQPADAAGRVVLGPGAAGAQGREGQQEPERPRQPHGHPAEGCDAVHRPINAPAPTADDPAPCKAVFL